MPPIQFEEDNKEFRDEFVHCNPRPPQTPTSTVIFWDWDDTLLCSSFLNREGYLTDTTQIPTEELEVQLRALEQSVINVLQRAMQFGDVHVVTNAETGWVQLSAQKYLPGVLPLLQSLPVLSARSTFQGQFPEQPLKWKYAAFQQKLSPFLSNAQSYKNVLSFGDSQVEREAVQAATRGCPNTKTKVVKFAERPSILQLQHQIDLIFWCFQSIHDHEEDLDLALSIKEDETCDLPEIPLGFGLAPSEDHAAVFGVQEEEHQIVGFEDEGQRIYDDEDEAPQGFDDGSHDLDDEYEDFMGERMELGLD